MKKAPILGCFCASLSHDGEALIIHKTNKINSLYVFFLFHLIFDCKQRLVYFRILYCKGLKSHFLLQYLNVGKRKALFTKCNDWHI